MQPFIVVAYREPTVKEAGEGKEPTLVLFGASPLTVLMAKDVSDAQVKAALSLTCEDKTRVKVLARPF